MELEVWEAMLAEEQVHDLHSFDGQDLSAELDKLHVCMVRVEVECTTEAGKLSKLFMKMSNVLVDLGTQPIRDIPQLLKTTQEVLVATSLIMEHLREEHASDAGPWD
jgi:hypothetical protein